MTLYFKVVDLEGKSTNKPSTSTQSSGKRHAENLDAAPAAKRQAIETSLGSPKSLIPGKTAALSRDSSFKSLDKGKVRPPSFGNNSSNDVVESTRSPSCLLPQTTKGMWLFCWLKSVIFFIHLSFSLSLCPPSFHVQNSVTLFLLWSIGCYEQATIHSFSFIRYSVKVQFIQHLESQSKGETF